MNDLSQNQIFTVMNNIAQQATGKAQITPVNTSEFVSVAQTTLLTGYDNVINAISQVLSRTIFSIRPYYAKFKSLQVDNIKYGNHVRKLQIVDGEFEKDDRLPLTDGSSVDMQKVNKPKVLQTNFYGQTMYEKSITIFRDQLDTAFSSPEEFGRFISMTLSNVSDLIEQAHEATSRLTLGNLIAGIYSINNAPQIVHLLTEYNALTGLKLTATTVYQPENFKPFIQWVYSRVEGISQMLTERSVIYHQNITDKAIARHTPKRLQKLYLYAPLKYQTQAMVLADTFNASMLQYGANEAVNYWQNINAPDQLQVVPTYLAIDGTLTTPEAAVTISKLFGILFDEEAAGYTVVNQWNANAPFNARGGYTNMFWHFTDRYWNDFTENSVIFLLD